METTIAGITFPNPFFNASGVCCTTDGELELLRDTGAGGIWTKTQTMEPREGNPHPRVFCLGKDKESYISGNSVGLANGGCAQMNQIVKGLKADQPIVLSVGGPDLFDIVQMIELSKDNDAISAIEINPSCPNLEGTDMLAFDFDNLEKLLEYIKMTGVAKPIGLKLPYYQNPGHFQQIAQIIANTAPLIRFVTCINGMPGLLFDPETNDTRTRANGGITGMGGDLMLPFALANVARFYTIFKEMELNVDIIGCGGVTCPEAAWQMIWAGAKGVQIGTKLLAEMSLPASKLKQSLSMFWNQMVLGLYSEFEKHGGFTSVEAASGGYHNMEHVIMAENIEVPEEELKDDNTTAPKVTIHPGGINVQISDNYANALALKDDEDFPPLSTLNSRRGRSRNRRIIPERQRYHDELASIEIRTETETSIPPEQYFY